MAASTADVQDTTSTQLDPAGAASAGQHPARTGTDGNAAPQALAGAGPLAPSAWPPVPAGAAGRPRRSRRRAAGDLLLWCVGPRAWAGARERLRRARVLGAEAGMATAEYAIATLAAVGFAGLLLVILRSDEVRGMLTGLIRQALQQ
ncbi:DUF4244 domain-containing protein [Cellulomonas soli]|uniref:DUF4244 domain-containing protein n=1 Tax=Cellulomonas soli TaxID=931535 RepID=UPI003F85FB8A